jgi:hypothetical protein
LAVDGSLADMCATSLHFIYTCRRGSRWFATFVWFLQCHNAHHGEDAGTGCPMYFRTESNSLNGI